MRDDPNQPANELPERLTTSRTPYISQKNKDHEEAYFRHVAVLRRHLKPLFRFLLGQIGRDWSVVASEVKERCRKPHIPREISDELLALACQQLGLTGKASLLYPQVVYVDLETGLICRRDGK